MPTKMRNALFEMRRPSELILKLLYKSSDGRFLSLRGTDGHWFRIRYWEFGPPLGFRTYTLSLANHDEWLGVRETDWAELAERLLG